MEFNCGFTISCTIKDESGIGVILCDIYWGLEGFGFFSKVGWKTMEILVRDGILSWCVDESACWSWLTEHLFFSFNYPLLAYINESMFF